MSSRRVWLKLALAMMLGLGVGVALFIATLTPAPKTTSSVSPVSAADLQGLFNQNSEVFDAGKLKGRYVLVYFGFTHCPDACPTALYNATLALQQLDPEAQRIQPVFVTVDPERDDPAQLSLYLANFSSQWLGLTGSDEMIAAVEQRFGIIALRHDDPALPGGYTMDHSDEFLLFSPNGKLLMRLPANVAADALLEQLTGLTRAEVV